jgi:hypothetical protein
VIGLGIDFDDTVREDEVAWWGKIASQEMRFVEHAQCLDRYRAAGAKNFEEGRHRNEDSVFGCNRVL